MQFNAIAEIDITPTPRRAAAWLEKLADYHPVVGRSRNGVAEVIITVEADILAAAAHNALYLVQDAAGPMRSFEVLATEEFDRRVDQEGEPAMLSTAQAAAELGVTRQRVVQLVEDNRLAGAMKVGRGYAIPKASVKAHLDTVIANARREVAAAHLR